MNLRKLWAFLRRDFLIAVSYKFDFFLQVGSLLGTILLIFFVSDYIQDIGRGNMDPEIQEYSGGEWFPFMLVGAAFTTYLGVSLSSFSEIIRNAQLTGTLEALLATPTRIPVIILFSSLFSFVVASFQVIVYLATAYLFFKVKFNIEFLAACVVLGLTIMCFSSIGILSASFIIVFKKVSPFGWLLSVLSGIFGGVFIPTSFLGKYGIEWISYFLPITFSLRGMRGAILMGKGIPQMLDDVGILGAYSLILLPLSLLAFSVAVRKARRDGTLLHY